MLRASRLLAATLAAATLAVPAVVNARVVTASFEARLVIVATCSVDVGSAVIVDCASATTPYLLDAGVVPSQRNAGPDAQRVTVYF